MSPVGTSRWSTSIDPRCGGIREREGRLLLCVGPSYESASQCTALSWQHKEHRWPHSTLGVGTGSADSSSGGECEGELGGIEVESELDLLGASRDGESLLCLQEALDDIVAVGLGQEMR